MGILIIIYTLLLIVIGLALFSIIQIKSVGISIKDFWSFISANQALDELEKISYKYEKLNECEQLVFLMEAEKVFDAFDKIPNMLWEEEYQKYSKVLDAYKDLKMLRWQTAN